MPPTSRDAPNEDDDALKSMTAEQKRSLNQFMDSLSLGKDKTNEAFFTLKQNNWDAQAAVLAYLDCEHPRRSKSTSDCLSSQADALHRLSAAPYKEVKKKAAKKKEVSKISDVLGPS